jgi:hypothetical protein
MSAEIKKYLDSEVGLATRQFLEMKANKLRSIENINEKDTAVKQALEVKAQKRAYKILKEILEEIMTFSQEVRPKDSRDRYDVGLEDEK